MRGASMEILSFQREDSREREPLRSIAMATYGRRVIDRLVGEGKIFRSLTDLQNATSIAYSTIHKWKRDDAEPSFDLLDKIVEAARARGATFVDAIDLLATDPSSDPGDTVPARARALAPFINDPDPIIRRAVKACRARSFRGAGPKTVVDWTRRFLLELELAAQPTDDRPLYDDAQALADLAARNRDL